MVHKGVLIVQMSPVQKLNLKAAVARRERYSYSKLDFISNLQGNVSHNIAHVRVLLSLSIKPRKLSIIMGSINCNTKANWNEYQHWWRAAKILHTGSQTVLKHRLKRCVPTVCLDTLNLTFCNTADVKRMKYLLHLKLKLSSLLFNFSIQSLTSTF